ncbi:LysR family transcriptional regulator [Terasakiella pusilla]|uniref:LysR family transcriptional regulator n=1 Tax=Terasakiella pusilla TaxID=64973 RepID=UPI003AA971CC
MKRNSMSIEDYQAVIAIAEENGFRPAAERLGMSASQLSRQINKIEVRLGVRLFDRDTRSVRPTHQGKVLIELAHRFLQSVEKAERDFQTYLQKGRGQLAIAGLPSITSGLLPKLLEAFAIKYSNLDITIHDGLNHQIISLLESGEADLAFTAGTDTTRKQLSFRKLANDPFVAVSSPHLFLADKEAYNWEEISRLPIIAISKGSTVREIVDSVCTLRNTRLAIRYEVSHLATAGALIAQGLGISILPKLTIPSLGTSPLQTKPLTDVVVTRDIGIVWPSGVTLSPAAQAFLEFASEHAPSIFKKMGIET